MSKGGATKFKKGMSGNPGGRPRVPDDIKLARQLTSFELDRILNKCAFLTLPQIEQLSSKGNTESPIFEMIVAKILHMAFKNGDAWRTEFILNRLLGRVRDQEPKDVTPKLMPGQIVKVTFEVFCTNAKYDPPYEKQLEMRAFGFEKEETRLLLGSRGYGKTQYVTIMGTAYQIYCDWVDYKNTGKTIDETNLIITKAKPRSKSIINEIGDALIANGVLLERRNANEIRVEGLIGQNHSAEAITIKTSMRGRHPKRITMDDPVTDEDTSPAMRKVVKDKYNEAMKLTKNILIIGQPAHAFDLYAELRGIVTKLEVPWGTIPELDHDLEAMKMAGVDQHSIQMSYHLKIPESGAMPFAAIKYIDKYPNGDSVAFIDPSDGGDYTALTILRSHFDGVAVQGHAWKRAWYHTLDEMIPILKQRGVRKLCFETNATGTQPLIQLRQLLKDAQIGVVGVHSDTNKHAVIMAAGSYSHLIHLSRESDPVYTKQVIQYEYKAEFDDSPDSLGRCLQWIGLIKGKK